MLQVRVGNPAPLKPKVRAGDGENSARFSHGGGDVVGEVGGQGEGQVGIDDSDENRASPGLPGGRADAIRKSQLPGC